MTTHSVDLVDGVDLATFIARIDRILVEQFEIEPERVVPSASLQADLEFDSLDGLDLVVALEKEFGFRVDDKVVLNTRTVGDIHALVRQIYAEQTARADGSHAGADPG